MKIADDKDEREDADGGDAADKNHGTYERACGLDDNADGNGGDDAGSVADEVEDAAGKTDGMSRSDVADGTPNDGGHALT